MRTQQQINDAVELLQWNATHCPSSANDANSMIMGILWASGDDVAAEFLLRNLSQIRDGSHPSLVAERN